MTKKPWLAALLNILVAGLGYLYVGKRKTFAVLLILTEVVSTIWFFTDPNAFGILSNPLITLASLFIVIAFAVDAYNEAK